MAVRFLLRRDTAANWTSVNPILQSGEPALETDTLKVKYGNGTTVWTLLPYAAGSGSASWGSITGSIGAQTDLYANFGALAATNNWSATQIIAANSAQAIFGFAGGNNYIDGTTHLRNVVNGTDVLTVNPTSIVLGQPLSATSAAFTGTTSVLANSAQAIIGFTGGNNYIDGTTYLRGTVNGSTVAQFAPSVINFYQPVNLTTALSIANGGTGGTTQATGRSGLGLGTAATANTGTSGNVLGFLNATNTYSARQTFDSIRMTHADAQDGNDGVIGAGTFTEGLNIVGVQTVAAAGRKISFYGAFIQASGGGVANNFISSTSVYANSAGVSLAVTGGFNYFDGTNVWRSSPGGTQLGSVSSRGLQFSSNGAQGIFGASGGNNYFDGTTYIRGTVNGANVAQFTPTFIRLFKDLFSTGRLQPAALTVHTGGNGYSNINPGSPTDTGFMEFVNAAGTRQGFIGYAPTGGPLKYVSDTGGGHLFTGGILNVNRAAGNTDVALFENTSTGSALNGIVAKIQSGGNNTSSFHFAGVTNGVNLWYLYGNGTTSYSSDERLKNRFEPARNGYLDDWKRLEFQRWNYANDDEFTSKNLGPTAQNVQKVFPSLAPQSLHEIELNGQKIRPLQIMGSVLYGEILGKVVQELAFAVDEQKSEIADLRRQIQTRLAA